MPQAARVDAAEALAQSLTDVVAKARDRHAADLATYREGIRRMSAEDGTLPPEESQRLLDAAARLGIPPDRLAADATIMLRHGRLTAHIDAVMQKAEQQARVVAGLQVEKDAESIAFGKVKVECDQRMRAAEASMNEVSRRYAAAAAVRPERLDEQRSGMRSLEDAAPHLFRDLDAEDLRRLLQGGSRA